MGQEAQEYDVTDGRERRHFRERSMLNHSNAAEKSSEMTEKDAPIE